MRLEGDDGWRYGTFAFNPHSLIAARLLDRDPAAAIDAAWVRSRIADAVALRARVCDGPYHRLVHAEADRLPGLVIDRFGDVAVVQANAAAMDRLLPEITAALTELLPLRAVVARNDSAARAQEGLPQEVRAAARRPGRRAVVEGGVRSRSTPLPGRRPGSSSTSGPTGTASRRWRPARACWTCSATPARSACAPPRPVPTRSPWSIAARRRWSARRRRRRERAVGPRHGRRRRRVRRHGRGSRRRAAFDLVVCDPPAFAKTRKDADAGLRAYQRMTRLAAPLVAPGGFLFVASCSHHAPLDAFAGQVAAALLRARRDARVLFTAGAGPDHPVHPHLLESAYLKAQLLQVI